MMDSSDHDVAELRQQINDKISEVRTILDLRTVAKEKEKQNILVKMGKNIMAINGLLDTFEKHVAKQRERLNGLKELEEFFQEDLRDGQHLRDNMPLHMPRKGLQTAGLKASTQSQQDVAPQGRGQNPQKKASRAQIREIKYITSEEFESIPQYMKGRTTYAQLNATVQGLNTAVKGKYSILQQPLKSLSNTTRQLHQRFKEEETKDTKGQFFIVEEDIREFTQMKIDKRFQGMLSMLRHCQRLREMRGAGHTRYLLL